MNLSRKWLNEFVQVDASDREFAEAMTLSGSKVETTEDLGAEPVRAVRLLCDRPVGQRLREAERGLRR